MKRLKRDLRCIKWSIKCKALTPEATMQWFGHLLISVDGNLHMNTESVGKALGSEVFWFPFVVQVVLTNHVWADFGCMQVEMEESISNRLTVIQLFISFFQIFLYLYVDLFVEISWCPGFPWAPLEALKQRLFPPGVKLSSDDSRRVPRLMIWSQKTLTIYTPTIHPNNLFNIKLSTETANIG